MKSIEKWFFAKFFFLKLFITSCCLLFFSKAPVLHKILWEVLLKPLLQTQDLKERGKQKKMKMKKAVLILPKWGLISQWLAGTVTCPIMLEFASCSLLWDLGAQATHTECSELHLSWGAHYCSPRQSEQPSRLYFSW